MTSVTHYTALTHHNIQLMTVSINIMDLYFFYKT